MAVQICADHMAAQLQPSEEAKPDAVEFENLRKHFEKSLKATKETPSNPLGFLRGGAGYHLPSSLLASIPGLASLASFSARSSTAAAGREPRLENYTPAVTPPDTENEVRDKLIQASENRK